MFFIGIFGIETKEKIIRDIKKMYCKGCNDYILGKVIKKYNFFHFFFIPIFKWNEKYYVIYDNCNHMYSISKEKGKSIEFNEEVDISYWDLKDIDESNSYYRSFNTRCINCGKEVENIYTYCPYCGNKLK